MSLIYAIVPARAGSKGLKDKNILKVGGKEMLRYSIDFAKKLGVDRLICSTDSEVYADIARKSGAEVPFLRSEDASSDDAMEQHILKDLYQRLPEVAIPHPNLIVWLRPTFVFRKVEPVKRCIERLLTTDTLSACRTVCSSEGRLYTDRGDGLLSPTFDDFRKSMIRRQDLPARYKVFSTDVFRSDKKDCSDDFLGRKIGYEVVDKICGLDIDDEFDFRLVDLLLTHMKDWISDYI